MYRFILMALMILTAAVAQAAQAQNTDNPGYFKTPGFVALAGTQTYSFGSTDRDQDVRPFALGMLNLIQSEYGNIGLSLGGIFITPSKKYENSDISYKISAQHFSTEFGLNYYTASKSVNFLFGAGYNINYVHAELYDVRGPGGKSSFANNYSDIVDGWHYYMGFEYALTKDGRWGIFLMFRGQEVHKAKFTTDETISLANGSTETFRAKSTLDLSNKTYMLGITYHF